MFTKSTKITTLIRKNHDLLPVLNRFNIHLGVKEKNISDICIEKNIDSNFFLAIVNSFNDESYFPENQLLNFSPLLIVDYLKNTHKHYIQYCIPKLERLLTNLIDSCTTNCDNLKSIKLFYDNYKIELLNHIEYEEKVVFPYINKIMESSKIEKGNFSIHSFSKEHSNTETKLNDLSNLIIKYLEPNYDTNICNEFLLTLFGLEKDLKIHSRIEDVILVPQIKKIEHSIANR